VIVDGSPLVLGSVVEVGATWIGLVLLPLVAWGILRALRRPLAFAGGLAPRGRWRRRAARGGLVVALLAGLVAAADLRVLLRRDEVTLVVALDVSRSVRQAPEHDPAGLLGAVGQARRPGDRLGVVAFGGRAATLARPGTDRLLLLGDPSAAPVGVDGSDLEAGLRRALAELPWDGSGRILLVSDGLATGGDALAAIGAAVARGVPVDVLPVAGPPGEEAAISRVEVRPGSAAPGAPAEIRVATRASTPTRARLTVRQGRAVVGDALVTLAAGDDVLRVRTRVPEEAAPGLERVEARLTPADETEAAARALGAPGNDVGAALLRVVGAPRALLLADDPVEAVARWGPWLEGAGLTVEGPGPRPALEPTRLAGYALVILEDLAARGLRPEELDALAGHVREHGGGLLMAGARRSFGLGGWAGTPVERVLPARFDLRERTDRRPLSMVFAIDVSGSMGAPAIPGGTLTKLDLANEAAARSAALLSPRDRVGVLHVDTEPTWVVSPGPVVDPEALGQRVRAAKPGGGGILVDVAVETGLGALRREPSPLAHLLLFADGGDAERVGAVRGLVASARGDQGITTSVVSMGRGPDSPELEEVSRAGGGRFYLVEDLQELPRVFTEETLTATGAALEERPTPVRRSTDAPVLDGIELPAAPALDGYAVVHPQPGSAVLLDTREAPHDPILAVWQRGAGRAAVLTVPPARGLGAPWAAWSGLPVLLGQLAQDLARDGQGTPGTRVWLDVAGGRGTLTVEVGGEAGPGWSMVAGITSPDGGAFDVPLDQVGVGRWRGVFPAPASGVYLGTVRGGPEEDAGDPRLGGLRMLGSVAEVVGAGVELRGGGGDRALLARLAGATGGRVLDAPEEAFEARSAGGRRPSGRPLGRWALVVALAAFFASVLARRWPIVARAGAPSPGAGASPGAPAPQRAPRARRAGAADDLPASRIPRDHGSGESPPPPFPEGPPDPGTPPSMAETLLARRRARAQAGSEPSETSRTGRHEDDPSDG